MGFMPALSEEHVLPQRPATSMGKVLPLLFSLLLCTFGTAFGGVFGGPAVGGGFGARVLTEGAGAAAREAISHNGEPVTDQQPPSRKMARWAQSLSPANCHGGGTGGSGGPCGAALVAVPFVAAAPGLCAAVIARDGAPELSAVPRASLGRAPPSTRL